MCVNITVCVGTDWQTRSWRCVRYTYDYAVIESWEWLIFFSSPCFIRRSKLLFMDSWICRFCISFISISWLFCRDKWYCAVSWVTGTASSTWNSVPLRPYLSRWSCSLMVLFANRKKTGIERELSGVASSGPGWALTRPLIRQVGPRQAWCTKFGKLILRKVI